MGDGGAWTALAAIVAALFAALATAWSAVQSRRTNSTNVDIRVFNSLREDFLSSKTQIRELERELDIERSKRRENEEQLHLVSRALYEAGINVPDSVAVLMRRPPNSGVRPP